MQPNRTTLKRLNKYSNEDTLVLHLKGKSKEAFTYLYDNYSSALFGVINRIVLSEEISNDILQEVFVKIWKNISLYSKEKGSLYTWMLNISRNYAIDTIRSKSYKNESLNNDLYENVKVVDEENSLHNNIDHIGLKELVLKLKPEHMVLINKVYFEGYTQEETSKEFNIPIGTVKTRLRAAVLQLRNVLKVNE